MAFRRSICLTGALLLASAILRSDTIYSNFGVPGPDGTGGGYALGPQFFFSGLFGLAVPFQPTADYTLDTIRIPITCNPNSAQNQFIVELYDGATRPATVLERYSRSVSGFSVVELDSSLHPALYAATNTGSRFQL
jgi:hypothetical protein